VNEIDFKRVSAQMVATLTRILGPRRLALAEEAAQDALVKALQTWPHAGVPANPSAWLIQVAKHRALDVLRRERWIEEHDVVAALSATPGDDPSAAIRLRGEGAMPEDDELAMMFLACHPILARDARVALTLKTVCGFGAGEIARAFLVREDAIAQRLVRAKRQLREADVSFTLTPDDCAERLESVLDVLYLLFNEGYAAHAGDDLVRNELCDEAIRLAGLLGDQPALATPTVHALIALMNLQAARLAARVDAGADLLRMSEQDRGQWDQALIAHGLRHLDAAAAGDVVTVYHLEAGIAACHAVAPRYEDTDWAGIVDLYDSLASIKPTPIVSLNRAIALSRLNGPHAGLAMLESIAGDPVLARYYLLPAAIAELSMEIGDVERASESYRAALDRECSEPERRFLERRLRDAASPERSANAKSK